MLDFMDRLKWIAALLMFGRVLAAAPVEGLCGEPDYLFRSGSEGYQCFRIPAVVKTAEGTILAFAEGRKKGCSDTGSIDLVLKRSADGGDTWGPLQVVWHDQDATCGNPAPVIDRTTGRILLLATWNLGSDTEPRIIAGESTDTRRVYLIHSDDEGETWSDPEEITSQVKALDWTWYATGPGHGIQLEQPRFRGRLVIPCDHIEAGTGRYYSHVIYSDDHGSSWTMGGVSPRDQVNECTVAEIDDGRLLLNMRNYDRSHKSRKISLSDDGGITWSEMRSDPALVEPVCQASLLRFDRDGRPGILLFLNPGDGEHRLRMTLRASMDHGATWPFSMILHPGPSAYSDMVQVNNREILALLEAGRESPYEGIALVRAVEISKLIEANR